MKRREGTKGKMKQPTLFCSELSLRVQKNTGLSSFPMPPVNWPRRPCAAVWLLAHQGRQWASLVFSCVYPRPLPLTSHLPRDPPSFSRRWWEFDSKTLTSTTTRGTCQIHSFPTQPSLGYYLRATELQLLEKKLHFLTEGSQGFGLVPASHAVTTSTSAREAAQAPRQPFW